MNSHNCMTLLEHQWTCGRHLCVGLDSDLKEVLKTELAVLPNPYQALFSFNKAIIDATRLFAAAYKANLAFYLPHGGEGLAALHDTFSYVKARRPDIPVILDAKFGDIGNTNNGYVDFAFSKLDADAVTVNLYMGGEALKPFLEYKDKLIFVLCRTSNPGAGEFQDRHVLVKDDEVKVLGVPSLAVGGFENPAAYAVPLYQLVAWQVSRHWNQAGNCGLVVGATKPTELEDVRKIAPHLPILIPGVGAQGGDLQACVKAAKHRFLINSSRGIIFAPNPGEEAEKIHNAITQSLKGD